MEPVQTQWDALTESAKAFADLLLREKHDEFPLDELPSYSQLVSENNQLRVEVASLKENPPFKDKYENLQQEFRKIAAERDSLSAQALKSNHDLKDYDRLKNAYQKTKGQLAAIQDQLEKDKSSISSISALEILYQGFKDYCKECGIDIRRIPTNVFLQFQLQDGTDRTMNLAFNRKSRSKWTKIN